MADAKKEKRCAHCDSKATKEVVLMWCGACKSVAYCSKEHQKAHWKVHKPSCRPRKEKTSLNVKSVPASTEFPQPENKTLECISKFILTNLVNNDFCVIDNLYSENEITGILSEVCRLRRSGVFKDAELSGGITATDSSQKYTDRKTRDDKLTWIKGDEPNVQHIANHMNYLDSVVTQSNNWLKQLGYNITQRTKAMVACYPHQAVGYRRHVDNPDGDGRCITSLLYLNKDWKENDGGKLRIYKGTGNIDVEPICNRLLMFWSDSRVPHEVLPSQADRYAITVWYFDSKERENAKQLQQKELNSLQVVRDALEEVEKKRKERDSLKDRLERATETFAIHNMNEDLQAMLTTYSTPEETEAALGIPPSVQKLFHQILEKREKWDKEHKNDATKQNNS